jgi:hypothetical protein
VLGDGRFAVFGGEEASDKFLSSCEAMTLDEDGVRWAPLSPMHEAHHNSACAVIGGCVIVTDGFYSVEIYEEDLGRWRRLRCIRPWDELSRRVMGGAVV